MSKRKRRDRQRTPNDFAVELQQLEIASGYDGLLRGAPEPVVVVGVYGPEPRTLLRAVFRPALDEVRFPYVIDVDEPGASGQTLPTDSAFTVLAVAIEDDGGDCVQRAFGALERAAQIHVVAADGSNPEPSTLADVARSPQQWAEPKRALVLVDAVPLSYACGDDDWVGAAVVCVPKHNGQRKHRLHLVSDDRLNDWTAVVATKVGWRA